ncbi:alpha/beta hydrolase [Microbacterium sp. AK031]|uniref:alpha/beta hydrolase n=1 Tax=Microbacterium sp. AK031 TaxID=2723076 RepID=UPI002167881E|nr:alpha/beta hydrolase [Microbacterium sp. AK031]MCS3844630.1 pimeloyl-ACP methyl ester carboxylesterase [Microbacterium sp. AK031]
MPPLVLLAGMNCTEDLWAGTGFEHAIHPALTHESMDAQVGALLGELPDRFVIAGLSLGAIVAMALALAAPERVAGMCLVSTNAKVPTPAQRAGWDDWIARLDAGEDPEALQERILPSLLSPDASQEHPGLADRVRGMGRATDAAALRAQLLMQGTRVDLLGRLSDLPTPTLVVSGRDDVICPPHFHTEIASEISRARLVSYDAGHLLPMEKPREFGRLLSSWRAKLRA